MPGPDAKTNMCTSDSVQRALNALSRSRFFAGLAERASIGFIKQAHRYFASRSDAQVGKRVAREIGPDTHMLVGHSLGSVYARPDPPVRALVTLGSPLGIRHLVFDRLQPAPAGGVGAWSGGVASWTTSPTTSARI